jgi:glucuronate isomerase
MRSNGVDEYYITGAATDCEKFQKWAETLELAIGNPLYHWSHLELQRYFGYHGVLNGDTAEEVWNLCNEKLKEDGISVRNLIRQSNVKLICTTDDPVDDLKWHEVLAADDTDRLGRIQSKTSCKHIWCVTFLFHNCHDFLFCLFTYFRTSIDDA